MSGTEYRVRRATVDDLAAMRGLWESMKFPGAELEKRITDFQLAVSGTGAVLGAVALEISGRQGILHSEAFLDFGHSAQLRQLLWHRMQSLATNHGLARLWTRESAPFWKQNGFMPADAETLKKLPPSRAADSTGWLTMKLRDEEALEKTLELEFAKLVREERRRTERAMRPGKVIKFVVMVTAVILAILVAILCVQMLLRQQGMIGR